jgi:hypothetical protein
VVYSKKGRLQAARLKAAPLQLALNVRDGMFLNQGWIRLSDAPLPAALAHLGQ